MLSDGQRVVFAGESSCRAGAPCLGDVVCDDGGATFLFGVEGEPCLGDDDCEEGGAVTLLLSGKEALGSESFAMRISVRGLLEEAPGLGDDD